MSIGYIPMGCKGLDIRRYCCEAGDQLFQDVLVVKGLDISRYCVRLGISCLKMWLLILCIKCHFGLLHPQI